MHTIKKSILTSWIITKNAFRMLQSQKYTLEELPMKNYPWSDKTTNK